MEDPNSTMESIKRRVGQRLSDEVDTTCQKCFGSGFQKVMKGTYSGVVKCDHDREPMPDFKSYQLGEIEFDD